MPPKTSKSKEDTATIDGGVTKKRGRGRPPSGDSARSADGEKRKKKGKERPVNYTPPIHRVLKQVNPDLRISKKSMMVRD